MSVTAEPTRIEVLEAAARKVMAERIEARGWDTAKARSAWLANVDAALDAWLAARG